MKTVQHLIARQENLAEISEEQLRALVKELLQANQDLQVLNGKLSDAQNKLMQSEKLASIGQLAAGVAHEINNPIGFIFSNFGTLEQYLDDVFQMLQAYEQAESSICDAAVLANIRRLREERDIAYLKEDIPSLMHESKDGIQRVRKIVQDLKDFSRVDARQEWESINLHQGIDSTLNIVNNEIKYKADVVKAYGVLPDVQCLPSEMNQVFLNLLVNAAHAITAERGTITIRTGVEGDNAWVEIEDNGAGITPENLQRIFDPFFTTKPVGKGTGLGLSLSYGIVQKHGGRISVRSEVGKGSCFRVSIPVHHQPQAQEPATS
ncbi:ATP-binding protein [Delftia sp. PS-11]|uniref:ATP-binding protein n=1 Tax=Delftia sp. PS-11 TaxID=2767222 RepID=UPI0024553120|nr:ATP-binding protein [Delftia sp. PS-11]